MSHIGKKIIEIPIDVAVKIIDNNIIIEGKYGILKQPLFDVLSISILNNQIKIIPNNNLKSTRAFFGLLRTLINNMIIGVTKRFTKTLIMEGVGYKFQYTNSILYIFTGFTNSINILIPDDILINVDSATKISLSGINKEKVGFFASKIYNVKPPETYKGKGILYEHQQIKRKIGKKGK